ncbi:hypothetical protein A2714_01225 [Candidatus Woesebacteria bacterium RIFCSPHIGHO2_01_FULL_38_9]|uniref:Response regulatory domain-containing protein n=2 Tax=Candidatus Woeseibacteriota TaxID=1752722 RepID=A0A1F7XZG5_9BACT|nr:MAG: hypothetical protein A2714_01225 [Candidatus Woesebacteria bacterium RIFCSPHIGHO2_01_FULL_38_9]OGM60894.1 MAG: hypothetical protein A3A75_02270 [Candidatus Woesebacteria bacterium RIFCSPLOWO2_01_FULL_39_10]
MEEFTNKRLLIVEDDQVLASLYEESYNALGVNVDVARDGLEALNKIKQNYYDLILLDLMLPHLDGVSILRKLDEEKVNYGKVVILTNLANEEFSELMRNQLKIEEYLIKAQHSAGEVKNIISKHLKNS